MKIKFDYDSELGFIILMYRDGKLVKIAKDIKDKCDFTQNMKAFSHYDKSLKNIRFDGDNLVADLFDGTLEFCDFKKFELIIKEYLPHTYKSAIDILRKKENKPSILSMSKAFEEFTNEKVEYIKSEHQRRLEKKDIIAREKARNDLIDRYVKEIEEAARKQTKELEKARQTKEKAESERIDLLDKKIKEKEKARIKEKERQKKEELRRKNAKANRVRSVMGKLTSLSLAFTIMAFCYNQTIVKINNYQKERLEPQSSSVVVAADYTEEKISEPIFYNIDIPVEYSEEKANEFLLSQEKYKDIIPEMAKTYGIDENILTAIAAIDIQERDDSIIGSGTRIGPMHIKYYEIANRSFRVYNYKEQAFELIEVKENDLVNPETNIKIGCAMIQRALRDCNGNIVLALESSELGKYSYKEMRNKVSAYFEKYGMDEGIALNTYDSYSWFTDIFKEPDNTFWGSIASRLPKKTVVCMPYTPYSGKTTLNYYIINGSLELDNNNLEVK